MTRGIASAGGWVLLLAVALYPVIVLAGLKTLGVPLLALLLLIMLLLRHRVSGAGAFLQAPALVTVAAYLLAVIWTEEATLLKLYPVMMSLTLLVAFAQTLAAPPSMVERIAKAAGTPVSAHGIRYARGVTAVWCVFFVLNAAIAAWTTFEGSMAAWTVYNGFVSYCLVAVLFYAEYLFRQRYKRRHRIHDDLGRFRAAGSAGSARETRA